MTVITLPKSICIHWFSKGGSALQACTESSVDRAWPVPGALPVKTELYVRSVSATFTVVVTQPTMPGVGAGIGASVGSDVGDAVGTGKLSSRKATTSPYVESE